MDSPSTSSSSEGGDEFVGSKGFIKKQELVRVIIEVLYSLGYDRAGKSLERVSGLRLHTERVQFLMGQILDGKWDESLATLRDIDESIDDEIYFLIFKEKISELLSEDGVIEALIVLKHEILPLGLNAQIVSRLTNLVLNETENSLASDVRSRKEVLVELLKLLPPEVVIPERRLVTLVEQTAEACVSFGYSMDLQGRGDEFIGSKRVVKQSELVRVITAVLYSFGYEETGRFLEEESGIQLHSEQVKLCIIQINDGKWDEALATLRDIGSLDERTLEKISLLLLERKFFELLYGDKVAEAVTILKNQIVPIGNCGEIISRFVNWIESPGQGSGLVPRKKVLEDLEILVPPPMMIPGKRLIELVEQALDFQRDSCRFHNLVFEKEVSLFTNHQCGREDIPSIALETKLSPEEVRFVKFSHNGNYLAASTSDGIVNVWKVLAFGRQLISLPLSTLVGHSKPVSYITWSSDDLELLTCGVEETVKRWNIAPTGDCLQTYGKEKHGMVSCLWAPNGETVFTGANDGTIIVWSVGGEELLHLNLKKTASIADMAMTVDGRVIITACDGNRIVFFDWKSVDSKVIEEDGAIASFSLSEDSKFLLVSMLNEEIHLWGNIGGFSAPEMVMKYKGRKCTHFVLRACFGGMDQGFIASGSEDSKVYIWNRRSGELICTLEGHSAVVKCVSWNPAHPHMLASGSDDGSIRVWGNRHV